MKTRTTKHLAATLVSAVSLALTGCKTPPPNPLATQTSPSVAGARIVVQTSHKKAEVTELVPGKSDLTLQSSAGTTTRCKIAPEVWNLSQIRVGAKVKVTLSDVVAVFLLKNGTPPSTGVGVTVAGTALSGQAASVVLQTTDARAKVFNVDRSYRLLKLEYADGSRKEYKFPLPDTLGNIQKGDEALVRTTEPLAICFKTK
jgi:hypothetical protein